MTRDGKTEGAGRDLYAIGPEPIELEVLCARVAAPGCGAIATFSGTVRESSEGRAVRYLEYEAYAPMALKVLGEIGARLRDRFPVEGVAIAHRTGRLAVGETSVAIAVSAPHRGTALQACAEAIETLKATLPVWKKEFFESGEAWRENEPGRELRPGRPAEPGTRGILPRDAG